MWSDATGLSAEQMAAVTANAAYMSVTAGPGAGKTRVLTRRIGYQVLSGKTPPRKAVALTFTRPAALEMGQRLAKEDIHGVTTSTFHGFGLRLLARRHADGLGPAPNLVKRAEICARLLEHRKENRITARQLDSEIGWATSRMLDAESYVEAAIAARRSLPIGFPDMAALIATYQAWKVRHPAIDFDDLILLPLAHLAQDLAWAAAVRWQYRHFFVDEFQDTTPLQFQLLQALLGDGATMCVVGDPKQSIFGFAGAQANAFDAFHARFPDAHRIELTENFRSGAAIVAAGNSLAESAMTAGGEPYPSRVVVQAHLNPEAEAESIAEAISQHGGAWGDHAVLARTYASLQLVGQALRERQIPTYRPGDLLGRREIRRVLHELKPLSGRLPAISVKKHLAEIVIDVLAHYNGERRRDDPFDDDFTDGDDVEMPPASPIVGPLELRLIRHNLNELQALLDEYIAVTEHGTLEGFHFWLEASTQEPIATKAPEGMVDLRTIHRAKGLEWHNVYLVGCTADLLPLWRTPDEAEERRLMFVAVTRASQKLVCSWPMNGLDRRGRPVRLNRSPYLTLIENRASSSHGEELSPAALRDLAAETIGQVRAFLEGVDRRPPTGTTGKASRQRTRSLVGMARLDANGFEERALTTLAARRGTTVQALRARIDTDPRLASEARILFAAAKQMSVQSTYSEEEPS